MSSYKAEGGLPPFAPAALTLPLRGSRKALRKLITTVHDYLRVSARKYLAPLIALCAMSACGFHPIHSREQREEWATNLDSVQIITQAANTGTVVTASGLTINSSGSQRLPELLKAEIQDQVNPESTHSEKLFVITITVSESEIALFINPDGTSSRGDMQYISSYQVARKLDGKVLDRGTITRISSYNISQNADYGTYVSREDARKRGILELAQDYKLRLANLLPKLNNPNTPEAKPELQQNLPQIHPQNGIYETSPSGV
jgi:hypothetical protein